VVWLDNDALLRPATSGVVSDLATTGPVAKGAHLITMEEPALDNARALAVARLEEMRLRLQSVLVLDRVQADVMREQVRLLESQLADVATRSNALQMVTARAGTVIVPGAEDLPGQRIDQGTVIGYLIDDSPMRLRIAVGQDSAELVRGRTQSVTIRFQGDLLHSVPAELLAELPESRAELPSRGLSTAGGGAFVLNPQGTSPLSTIQSVFQFEVAPTVELPIHRVGERALVRFDHGTEPLGWRMWRSVRQLFLRQFSV